MVFDNIYKYDYFQNSSICVYLLTISKEIILFIELRDDP